VVNQERGQPFEICDWSVKEPFSGDWKTKARARIKKCGQMIVLCGEHTHTATGVAAELKSLRKKSCPTSYWLVILTKPARNPQLQNPRTACTNDVDNLKSS